MTIDGFSTLIGDTRAFLRDLAANNSRDWFTAHKPAYEAQVRRPALLFLDAVAARLEQQVGTAVTPKLYRIHRDLRFAKDKTPYNTHLHLQWSAAHGIPVTWLFGLSESYFCAGVGMMRFAPTHLAAWRSGIAGPSGAGLATDLAGLLANGHRIDPPELTRVPPPFGKDHPRGDLLRRKSLVVWHDFEAAASRDPVSALMKSFQSLAAVQMHLNSLLASG